jgi:hypothetical protein
MVKKKESEKDVVALIRKKRIGYESEEGELGEAKRRYYEQHKRITTNMLHHCGKKFTNK